MDLLELEACEYIYSLCSPEALSGEDALNNQVDTLENWTHSLVVRCLFLQPHLCFYNGTIYVEMMVAEIGAMQEWNSTNIFS